MGPIFLQYVHILSFWYWWYRLIQIIYISRDLQFQVPIFNFTKCRKRHRFQRPFPPLPQQGFRGACKSPRNRDEGGQHLPAGPALCWSFFEGGKQHTVAAWILWDGQESRQKSNHYHSYVALCAQFMQLTFSTALNRALASTSGRYGKNIHRNID